MREQHQQGSGYRQITPKVWGEPMWRMMHIVAMGYPQNPRKEQRQAYKAFYSSLRTVLPCSKCAAGYSAIYDRHPIDDALSGPEDLFLWTVVVHNEVARKLGHPEMSPEFVQTSYVFGDDASAEDPAEGKARGRATAAQVSARLACAAAVVLAAGIVVWAVAKAS